MDPCALCLGQLWVYPNQRSRMSRPDNATVIGLALPMLIIAAIAQVLDGFQKAVYRSLQGLQDNFR